MDFIIDRTSEDVAYAQSLVGAIWSKMTNEQQAEWLNGINNPLESLKGFFNYTDMLRIKNNYNDLLSLYGESSEQITTNYSMSTIPNRTTMSADFEKVRQFSVAKLPYFVKASFNDYRTPQTLSSDVNKIDYNFLNNYEHILKNLYDYHNDNELRVECDYLLETNKVSLDGVLRIPSGKHFDIKIPSGFITKVQNGTIIPSGDFISMVATYIIDNDYHTYSPNPYGCYRFEVMSGVQNDTLVGDYGTSGNTVDTTLFDTVRLDSDLLRYSQPTTYVATESQSDMIDVSSLEKMYCYDISVLGENTIVTLYDENEDVFDEIALREDTFIDLTNASYITFDTDVDTEITYVTSDGTTIDRLVVTINGTSYNYPEDKTEFDVSEVNSIKIMYPAPTSNKFVCNIQKSIIGGKDISQLDTSEIEVKYY